MESQINQKWKEDIQQKYNILNTILNNLKNTQHLNIHKNKKRILTKNRKPYRC
jgi:hypothetical protein